MSKRRFELGDRVSITMPFPLMGNGGEYRQWKGVRGVVKGLAEDNGGFWWIQPDPGCPDLDFQHGVLCEDNELEFAK